MMRVRSDGAGWLLAALLPLLFASVLACAHSPSGSGGAASPSASATAAISTTTSPPPATPSPTPAASATPIALPSTAQLSAPARDVLWVLMAGEALFLSRDQGQTWQPRGTAPGPVSFVDEREGWALAAGSPATQCQSQQVRIFHTTDGAAHWLDIGASGIGDAGCKADLSFVDAAHGFLVASSPNTAPAVYRTADGGLTWQASAPLPDPPGFSTQPGGFSLQGGPVRAYGARLLMPVQANVPFRFVYASDDGGSTWHHQATTPEIEAGFALVSATRWLLIGAPQTSQETTDAGATWHSLATDYTQAAPVAPIIVFADSSVGYATVRGAIQRSLDGGLHWSQITSPGTR